MLRTVQLRAEEAAVAETIAGSDSGLSSQELLTAVEPGPLELREGESRRKPSRAGRSAAWRTWYVTLYRHRSHSLHRRPSVPPIPTDGGVPRNARQCHGAITTGTPFPTDFQAGSVRRPESECGR